MSRNTHTECCLGISCRLHEQAIPGLSRQGFTLIEVLVAMTILMGMVIMIANMFSAATGASNSGNDRSEVETAGRAALGFMSMKLSQAIAGPVEPVVPPFNWSFDLDSVTNVSFCLVSDTIQSNRFYFDGSNLMYGYGINNGVLIENVIDMKIYAYDKYDDFKKGNYALNCHLTNNLPYCVDIGIRLISYGDNNKYQQMRLSGANTDDFLTRNCRWFTTRVYFQTRQGYIKHEYGEYDRTR